MSATLIDSWGWIEFFNGSEAGRRIKQIIDSPTDILASAMNVAEVYHFLLRKKRNKGHIDFILKRSRIIPVDAKIALKGTELKHAHKLGLADALILATAQAHNATLITGDMDFKGFDAKGMNDVCLKKKQ